MINAKIQIDVSEEFTKLRKNIENSFLSGKYDIDATKKALQSVMPKEVLQSANLLLDTLLNYLMEESIVLLKGADIEIRNAFFRSKIDEKIKQWAKDTTMNLLNNASAVDFGKDTRLRNALIAGGVTFIAGASVTKIVFVPYSTIATIVSSIITLIASAFVFKIVFDKSSNKVRENINQSVKEHLKQCENLTKEWLGTVIKAFCDDFKTFCNNNNIQFEGEIQ